MQVRLHTHTDPRKNKTDTSLRSGLFVGAEVNGLWLVHALQPMTTPLRLRLFAMLLAMPVGHGAPGGGNPFRGDGLLP